MHFTFNDGGRAAAGYRGQTGDCVTRAIAIATQQPYQAVYEAMAEGNATERRGKRRSRSDGKRTARMGIHTTRKWFKRYLAERGWTWTPTMFIGSGCRVHLKAGELPSGRLIVALSGHMAAVIDGVLHDLSDCSRNETRCVYGYWSQ
jgi:hypothetical protein